MARSRRRHVRDHRTRASTISTGCSTSRWPHAAPGLACQTVRAQDSVAEDCRRSGAIASARIFAARDGGQHRRPNGPKPRLGRPCGHLAGNARHWRRPSRPWPRRRDVPRRACARAVPRAPRRPRLQWPRHWYSGRERMRALARAWRLFRQCSQHWQGDRRPPVRESSRLATGSDKSGWAAAPQRIGARSARPGRAAPAAAN